MGVVLIWNHLHNQKYAEKNEHHNDKTIFLIHFQKNAAKPIATLDLPYLAKLLHREVSFHLPCVASTTCVCVESPVDPPHLPSQVVLPVIWKDVMYNVQGAAIRYYL